MLLLMEFKQPFVTSVKNFSSKLKRALYGSTRNFMLVHHRRHPTQINNCVFFQPLHSKFLSLLLKMFSIRRSRSKVIMFRTTATILSHSMDATRLLITLFALVNPMALISRFHRTLRFRHCLLRPSTNRHRRNYQLILGTGTLHQERRRIPVKQIQPLLQ